MTDSCAATTDRPRVTIVLPHREGFGPGAAGAVASVVRRMTSNGSRYDALVIGPRFAGPPFADIPFRPVSTPGWLPMKPTQSYALIVARALAALPATPIEVHNKPDVAVLLARLFPRRPVTLFLHNDPRTMRGARTVTARAGLLRRLARVVVVPRYLADAMLDGLDPAPVGRPLVLHNTIGEQELPAVVPMPDRDPVILFVGRVVPEKAPDAFVAACAAALPHLPAWRAEIIGANGFGAGVEESRFIRMLRPVAGAAGIAMRGFMPHDDVLRAMARSAVVVVPSRWPEPFGLTALEAMACGAALACSGRGGLSEVTGDCCLRIDPDDVDGFARILVRLGQDGPLRARLSEAGQARAREWFGVTESVAWLDAMRDAIAGTA